MFQATPDAEDGADEGNEQRGVEGDENKSKSTLPWLMSRMSFVARHLILNRPAAHEQVRSIVGLSACRISWCANQRFHRLRGLLLWQVYSSSLLS